MKKTSFVIVEVMVCFCAFALGMVDDGLEPPKNPFLADSPWPMSHRNPYCQASSPYPGPSNESAVHHYYLQNGTPRTVAITLTTSADYPNGDRVIWASHQKQIQKLNARSGIKLLHTFEFPANESSDISGAYTLIDRDNVFYTSHSDEVFALSDSVANEAASSIKLLRRFKLPGHKKREQDESIIGLNLTYDGSLVFVTDRALVGVIRRDFTESTFLRIGSDEEVSNSIAVDEDGGIYVVTSRTMNRVDWKNKKLELKWSVPYASAPELLPGRLGMGSGTTPTLIGSGKDDKLVVIADGQRLMHLVAYWRDKIPQDWGGKSGRDRRVAGEIPLHFGNLLQKRSVTEQSLLVRGYEMVAVNNDYGNRPTGPGWRYVTILRSNVIAPKGVEKIAWVPSTRELKTVWVNREVSCPNGIPTMSVESNAFYCIGAFRKNWTFEALNWTTGQHLWRASLGKANHFNSFYAATEVGWDGSLLSGTLAGFLRLTD